MEKPILIVMAAGMGSRYGGMKQVDPVGPNGQTIMDYSLYDAKRAGFERVVFVISPAMERTFPQTMQDRIGNALQLQYATQHLEDMPHGYAVPEGRMKPWGTGHAIRACRALVDAPFAAINADDYYGPGGLEAVHTFLMSARKQAGKYAMVGYELSKTLSKRGHVARGICKTDGNGKLVEIDERIHIIWSSDGPLYTEDEQHYHRLPADAIASMNLWGFSLDFMDELDARFARFLDHTLQENPMKGEYYLPGAVGDMLSEGAAAVDVLPCTECWYGMTYQEDRPVVEKAIADMTRQGLYPPKLW